MIVFFPLTSSTVKIFWRYIADKNYKKKYVILRDKISIMIYFLSSYFLEGGGVGISSSLAALNLHGILWGKIKIVDGGEL